MIADVFEAYLYQFLCFFYIVSNGGAIFIVAFKLYQLSIDQCVGNALVFKYKSETCLDMRQRRGINCLLL
jgi:hypothetical protein